MALWRVDVAGVSNRMVEADSKTDAVEAVGQALLRALDLRASPADKALARYYAELSPGRQRRFLAAMDGLSSPQSRDASRRARRRLARMVRHDREFAAWIAGNIGQMPADPEGARRIARTMELEYVETIRRRLHHAEVTAYGETGRETGYSI